MQDVNTLDAENAFKIFDTDGSGTIEFDEFVMSLLLKDKPTVEQFASICMSIYDQDGDGFITEEEMKRMGHTKLRVTNQYTHEKRAEMDSSIETLFNTIDKDRNGKITRAELLKALKENPELQTVL
eukprot:TRINITY_DN11106_c0_g2_i1.p1 TRINITY_DN11106_c0_g2~~TRINITY_DN11106_c0_g2_i1.p1  ORF type:complete len:126 (+),score=30.18 TRINITY_DN11106_c0_g2_i1:116-493(+)